MLCPPGESSPPVIPPNPLKCPLFTLPRRHFPSFASNSSLFSNFHCPYPVFLPIVGARRGENRYNVLQFPQRPLWVARAAHFDAQLVQGRHVCRGERLRNRLVKNDVPPCRSRGKR